MRRRDRVGTTGPQSSGHVVHHATSVVRHTVHHAAGAVRRQWQVVHHATGAVRRLRRRVLRGCPTQTQRPRQVIFTFAGKAQWMHQGAGGRCVKLWRCRSSVGARGPGTDAGATGPAPDSNKLRRSASQAAFSSSIRFFSSAFTNRYHNASCRRWERATLSAGPVAHQCEMQGLAGSSALQAPLVPPSRR